MDPPQTAASVVWHSIILKDGNTHTTRTPTFWDSAWRQGEGQDKISHISRLTFCNFHYDEVQILLCSDWKMLWTAEKALAFADLVQAKGRRRTSQEAAAWAVSHAFRNDFWCVCLNKASGARRFSSQKVHWTPLLRWRNLEVWEGLYSITIDD